MVLWLKAIGMVFGIFALIAGVVTGLIFFFMWVGVQWIPAIFLGVILAIVTIAVHGGLADDASDSKSKSRKDVAEWWE